MKQMKRLAILAMLLLTLVAVLAVTASAKTVKSGTCGENLTWTLDDTGTLTISGTGNMSNYSSSYPSAPWYSERSNIKTVIVNNGVTSIGGYAFEYCNSLTSITIPDSVTSIGSYAFYNCYDLTSITIPDSVTSIGSYAFGYCNSLTAVHITDIAAWCNISFDSMNSNPLSYGKNLYLNGELVTNLVIPDSVASIGSYAFSNCSGLTSITIPDSVARIGSYAFYNCSGLTSITIPDSVTSIGSYAFSNCSSLTSITISDSVTSIGSYAFNCDITKLIIAEGSETVTSTMIVCEGTLQEIVIPDSVTSIGDYAFQECSILESIIIPESVTSIGRSAFLKCSNLENITIPNNVTVIGDYAFKDCTSLQNVIIGNSVTRIGTSAFYGTNLQSVTMPDSINFVGQNAFSGVRKLIIAEGSESVTATMVNPVYYLQEVVIPDTVTSIGTRAFSYCYNLRNIIIPDSVAHIGEWAFEGCEYLLGITMGSGVKMIDSFAFYDCKRLDLISYAGTKEQRNNMQVEIGNDPLAYADWKYNVGGTESIFADINVASWQYTATKYACKNGLMAGKGTDKEGKIIFDPNSPISREEFVQVLYNAEGKPSINGVGNKFPDVGNNAWYKNAVLWANQNNIANGMGNGNFGVGKNITRQDLALMLYKYAKLKGYSLAANTGEIYKYADGHNVASYAQEAMNWAVTNGILSGKGTAGKPISTFRLDPAGTATRAECAAMLKNFMEAFGL